jgi:pilus assembly protein Flp/PilA
MNNLAKRFVKDESGATAIEYGLIAAGISVAIIAVVNSLGSQLKTTFTNVSSQLATAGNGRRDRDSGRLFGITLEARQI